MKKFKKLEFTFDDFTFNLNNENGYNTSKNHAFAEAGKEGKECMNLNIELEPKYQGNFIVVLSYNGYVLNIFKLNISSKANLKGISYYRDQISYGQYEIPDLQERLNQAINSLDRLGVDNFDGI